MIILVKIYSVAIGKTLFFFCNSVPGLRAWVVHKSFFKMIVNTYILVKKDPLPLAHEKSLKKNLIFPVYKYFGAEMVGKSAISKLSTRLITRSVGSNPTGGKSFFLQAIHSFSCYHIHIFLSFWFNLFLSTVPAPIKVAAASIQKLFFEHTHYDAFYQKSFTHL